jgi:hypothetical protein
MAEPLVHIPMTASQIQALIFEPDSALADMAREKLQLWAGDQFGSGLWVRAGQIWQRANGRRFLVAGFWGTMVAPTARTEPLSPGGRPSLTSVRRLGGIFGDAEAPSLIESPPALPRVVKLAAVRGAGKKQFQRLVEGLGGHLAGCRFSGPQLQLEIDGRISEPDLRALLDDLAPGAELLSR